MLQPCPRHKNSQVGPRPMLRLHKTLHKRCGNSALIKMAVEQPCSFIRASSPTLYDRLSEPAQYVLVRTRQTPLFCRRSIRHRHPAASHKVAVYETGTDTARTRIHRFITRSVGRQIPLISRRCADFAAPPVNRYREKACLNVRDNDDIV